MEITVGEVYTINLGVLGRNGPMPHKVKVLDILKYNADYQVKYGDVETKRFFFWKRNHVEGEFGASFKTFCQAVRKAPASLTSYEEEE